MLRAVAEGVKYVSELDPSLQEKIGEPNLEPHGHNVHPLFYLLFRILKLKFVKNVFLGPNIRRRRDFGERTPTRPLRARPRTVKARPVKARQNPPLFYVSPTAPPIPHIAAQLRPLGMFTYNPIHQVIICHACRSCLVPGPRGQRRHVQAEPHRLMGAALTVLSGDNPVIALKRGF